MRTIHRLRLRLRSLFRSSRVEQELDEELRYHVERLVDDYIAGGMSAAEARYAALREMGAIEQRKEECRDARGLTWLDSLRQDVVYALRGLRKTPGFSIVAILSLTIGIGANTTIFTFVNAVLLRPLPYPSSERLVILREQLLGAQGTVNVHPVNFVEWRARARSFEALALVQPAPLNVMDGGGAEQIGRAETTSELFRVFALAPALGRMFTDEETGPGKHDVVILGHGFWQRRFGGDRAVLGRALQVPGGSLTIVGVAPAGLRVGVTEPEVYTPLALDPADPGAIGSRSFQCYGRLKPGVSLEMARAEMTVIASTLARQHRLDDGFGVFVSGLHEYLVADRRPGLRLLMAVVVIVLVIASANLASLLTARGLSRRGELAVRASLGASRGRLIAQLVVESLVLAVMGGISGFMLAHWATDALVKLTAGALSIGASEPIRLDATSLAFTLLISVTTALVFGLVPAWLETRTELPSMLRTQNRGVTADRRLHRLRNVLVVTEVALAVVLLVGAGLLLRTFSSLVRVDLGFQPTETLTMNLFLGMRSPEARVAVVDQILDRVAAVPGVKVASTIQFLPLTAMQCGTGFWLEGRVTGDPSGALPTDCSLISRGYFATMGIPVLEGRPFDPRDGIDAPRVLMVNRSFGRRYFPDGRVLGRRILVSATNQQLAEIIGVAGDVRHNGLTSEPVPTVYLLHSQTPGYITNLVVRTTGEPGSHAAAIRRAIHEVDPMQAVSQVKAMEEYLGDALARPRLYAVLIACFAAVAVTLAIVGVYGLVAYVVARRTHEIGIRLALGAARGTVFRDVLREGAQLVGAGLAVGILAAVALQGLVSSLLFGISAGDPVSYAIAAVAFSGVGLAVVAIPARRASRVNPVSALRYE